MSYIPKRIIYSNFPTDGLFGISACQALELAIDGHLVAYHLLAAHVSVYEHQSGNKYVGASLGSWHGLTVKVPRGVLYRLSFDKEHRLVDDAGQRTAITVEGPIGAGDIQPDIPPLESYLLWPEGEDTIMFDRDKLFFLASDLEQFSSTNLPARQLYSQSDAAIGAATRARQRAFAQRQADAHDAREVERQRWRKAANDIQSARSRPASKRELAELVKSKLELPDSAETIRKQL